MENMRREQITMSVAGNLAVVHEKIEKAAKRTGTDPEGIKLVAVSKTVEPRVIAEALDAGVDILGENRVQEALDKQEQLPPVSWHLIGHLQTNKVRKVIGKFDLIHSLDSLRLASELGRRSVASDLVTSALVQVNVGLEESKYGIEPDNVLSCANQAHELGSAEAKPGACHSIQSQ
jgi:pyridoxal phosphate enzyme (YggS family)